MKRPLVGLSQGRSMAGQELGHTKVWSLWLKERSSLSGLAWGRLRERLVLGGGEGLSCLFFGELPHPRMFRPVLKGLAPPERVWFSRVSDFVSFCLRILPVCLQECFALREDGEPGGSGHSLGLRVSNFPVPSGAGATGGVRLGSDPLSNPISCRRRGVCTDRHR